MHTVCFCQNVIEYQFHHSIQNLEWKPWQFKSCIFKLTLRYKCALCSTILFMFQMASLALCWKTGGRWGSSSKLEKRSYKTTRVQRSAPMCRSAESVAWTVHVKLTSLPSHPSSADFTTFDGQSLILLQMFLDMWTPCDTFHLGFIWFIIGAIFTHVSWSTAESNFNDMHSSLFNMIIIHDLHMFNGSKNIWTIVF